MLKIGYFADGPWAHRAFERVVSDHTMEIKFICVRFDHRDEELLKLGRHYGIDVIWNENVNSLEFIEKMKAYDVDLFVSMSFNQIFREQMINLPPLKTINCHAGKLPYYRGRNILNWALINDEKEFGITVHYVDEGIDTGDIILQRTFAISDKDNYGTLLDRAYIGCADVLYDAIKMIQGGNVERIKQSLIDPVGMYCGIRLPGDELLNWNQTSRDIFNFVRALSKPGPQATCYVRGTTVKINSVKMVCGAPVYKGIPGQIIGKSEKGFYVKTLDTMVEIIEYESTIRLKVGDRLRLEE